MSIIDKINKEPSSILVFGDIMLDEFILGHVDRISPEAPVPVVVGEDNFNNLGGCGNVIRNLINIGVHVDLISAIGNDKAGQIIKEKLSDIGLSDAGLLTCKEIRTTRKIRVIADRQHIVRVDWDYNVQNEIDYRRVFDILSGKLKSADGIIISDYNKGFCSDEAIRFLIESSKKDSKVVFVDPKGENWDKYSGATIITPNVKETEIILKKPIKDQNDIEISGKKICDLYDIETCVITRGPKGISVIDNDGCFHVPSNAKEVFDVSGAGDTVIAALASSLLSKINLVDSVKFANKAAGIVVGHVGTTPISKIELESP